jgi:hypothetical protein
LSLVAGHFIIIISLTATLDALHADALTHTIEMVRLAGGVARSVETGGELVTRNPNAVGRE